MNANPDSQDHGIQSDSLVATESNHQTAQATSRPHRLRSCILVLGSILMMLFAGAYFYQLWYGPKVDHELVKDVQILAGGGGGSDVDHTREIPSTNITAGLTEESIQAAEHPLIPALEVARLGLENIEKNVFDYEAIIVKQALVKKKLTPIEHMKVKIRHQRELEDGTKIPFSVYTKFLSPDSVVGQEAIFVEGWNDGNLIAHAQPGFLNVARIPLKPDSFFAMRGNIYPITMIGIKNLVKQMIEKGTRDLEHDECEVTFDRNIEIDGRKCMLIEITHPVERDYFEFHKAKIYIDLEYEVPVAYEGFLWPKEEGGEPQLLEKYIYTELKINCDLDDTDFDPDNEDYLYPG